MDLAAPATAAAPVSALALSLVPAPAKVPLAPPGLLSPSPPLSSGQEADGSERRSCLWRPWLCSTNDSPSTVRKLGDLATGGATSAEVTKADSEFHHPVRLFWPKSRFFDYLYSDGEILLQNFPVQATINLYEDSNSEEEEEEKEEDEEKEEKKEADEKWPEGRVRVSGDTNTRSKQSWDAFLMDLARKEDGI
ncbi:PREDICTED: protein ripply1 [Hipposideros armiger]|uniref:Protein ripply1 n=1 Tax=Hipposideros armiger TaxID=186990 RepID=A0A8B7SW85_HIPAR|nr:PREDICTED: protein ripply1 [Hipposideros armiger]